LRVGNKRPNARKRGQKRFKERRGKDARNKVNRSANKFKMCALVDGGGRTFGCVLEKQTGGKKAQPLRPEISKVLAGG